MSTQSLSRAKKLALVAIVVIILAISGSLYFFFGSGTPTVTTSVVKPKVHRYVTEYPVGNSSYPNGIAVDSQGRIWFASWNETALDMLIPSNSTLREYRLPEPAKAGLQTWGIAIDNSAGVVYFTDPNSNAVWSFGMRNHTFVKHPVITNNSFPYQIIVDQSGNVWFSELFSNKLAEITNHGVMREYTIPPLGNITDTSAGGLAIDGHGTIWFTEPRVDAVGSFSNGVFHEYNLSGLAVSPNGMAVDSQGNLWITEHPGNFIAEFNPATNYFRVVSTSLPTSDGSLPYFDYLDSHGNVWFNEHYGNAIGEYFPENGTMLEYVDPTRIAGAGNLSFMLTMALSPTGQPWFTELLGGKIGTVNITAPIQIGLSLANESQRTVDLPQNGSAHLPLIVRGGSLTVAMKVSSSAYTSGLNFSFSQNSGSGEFSPTLTVTNSGARAGTYSVAISAETQDLIVSQIVDVIVS